MRRSGPAWPSAGGASTTPTPRMPLPLPSVSSTTSPRESARQSRHRTLTTRKWRMRSARFFVHAPSGRCRGRVSMGRESTTRASSGVRLHGSYNIRSSAWQEGRAASTPRHSAARRARTSRPICRICRRANERWVGARGGDSVCRLGQRSSQRPRLNTSTIWWRICVAWSLVRA